MRNWNTLALFVCLFIGSICKASVKSDLDDLSARYDSAFSSGDEQKEIAALTNYMSESVRMGDVQHEGRARTLRLYLFYNRNMPDSLQLYLPADLEFFSAHGQWDFYYSCWSLRVERLQYENKLHTAFREAKEMYSEAQRRKSDYGQGVSAYLIASCYQSMARDTLAISFFLEAEKYLKKENNIGQLHNLYSMTWQSLAATGRYDEILSLAHRWEKMWNVYCKENDVQPEQLAPYFQIVNLARVHAFREKGNVEQAWVYLEKARLEDEKQRDIARLFFLKEEIRCEEQAGNYREALELTDERLNIQQKMSNKLSSFDTRQIRAGLLLKLNQPMDAALQYQELLAEKDSVNQLEMAAQLDELGSLYNVDRYRQESLIRKQQFQFAVAICVLFAIILLILYRSFVLLRRKNLSLCSQLEQLAHHLRKKEQERLNTTTANSFSPGLFERLSELLLDEKIHLDPGFNREMLIERLGTNKNKLSEAVFAAKSCSLMEYITELRLQEALLLMESQPDLPLVQMAERVGFGAYSSFYRAFYKQYGVKPIDYKNYRKK